MTPGLPLAGMAAPFTPPSRRPLHRILWFLGVLTVLCYLAHQGRVLSLLFTPLCAIFGIYLLRTSRHLYLSFNLWLWCLSPLVRRMADYVSSYHDQSLIIMAPVLVTLLGTWEIWRNRERWLSPAMLAFLLPLIGIGYSLVLSAVYGFLHEGLVMGAQWILPLVSAMYCYFAEDDQFTLATEFQRTAVRACIVVGIYGLYQYLNPPAWDAFWLTNVTLGQIAPSFGTPVPFGIRVFSTMHAPGVMAPMVATGLLLTYGWKSRENLIGIPFMMAALIFSEVRTSWIGLVAGFVYLLFKATGRTRAWMLGTAVALAVMAPIVLAAMPGSHIMDRFATFGDMKHDGSAQARAAGIRDSVELVADQPLGHGVGYMESPRYFQSKMAVRDEVAGHDVGLFEPLIELGLPGSLLYAAGMAIMVVSLFRLNRLPLLPVHVAMVAVCVAFLTYVVSSNPFIYLDGLCMWSAAAFLFRREAVQREAAVALPQSLQLRPEFAGK